MKIVAGASALFAAASLGACATVTMGTTQEIAIDAEPVGAECRVEKRGVAFATLKAPAVTSVPRSGDTLAVTCSSDGFQPDTQHISPSFSGMTIGNVLLGGLIGVAVDAASGANNQYPSRVAFVLMPLAFDSAESRDIHFSGASARARQRADEEIALKRSQCSQNQKELCDINVKQVEERRDQMLATLESKRQTARIAPGGITVAAASPQRLPPVPAAGPPPSVSVVPTSDRPLSAEEGRAERERRILAEEKRLMEERERIVDAEKRVLEEERRAAEEKRQAAERERRAAEAARVAALSPPTAPASPYPTANVPARTVAVQRAVLPPGTDGSWRGTYTCDANSMAVPVALEVDVRLSNAQGQAVYARQGAQTHSLTLNISGGKASFTRVSETAGGRPMISTLSGPVSGDTISFSGTEGMASSGTIGAGPIYYYHCTVSLTRGL